MKNRFLLLAITAFTTTRAERQQHDVCEVTLQQLEIGFLNEFFPRANCESHYQNLHLRMVIIKLVIIGINW